MSVMSWAKLDVTGRKETCRALAVGEITTGKAVNRTKGPVEATIAALLHLGWKPAAPDHWVVSNSTLVKLDGKVYTRFQITARAQHDGQVKLWQKAARHADGEGLETGIPNLQSARNAACYLRKCGHTDAARAIEYIVV
mgnify:CR=1 FL=1